MSGLLGNSWEDPQSQAIMALAGGLLQGNFGGGLLGANDAFQKAATGKLQREDLAQNIQMRNIQLQQAQQQFDMMRPILQHISQQFGDAPQGAPQGGQPAIAPSAGGALGSGTFGIPSGGQPAAAPVGGNGGGSMFGLPASVAGPVLALGGPGKLAEAITSANAPTDFMKLLNASGIDPGSAIGRQLIQSNIAKQNYTAPVNARPGSILRDPFDPSKTVAFNPHIPEGSRPVFDAQGNVQEFQPIGNAEAALSLGPRASAFGKAQATPSVVFVGGVPQFSTVARDVERAQPGPRIQPADTNQGAIFGGEIAQTQAALADPQNNMTPAQWNDPQKRADQIARWNTEIAGVQKEAARNGVNLGGAQPNNQQRGSVTPVLPPGAAQGANLSQEELSKKWQALSADNAQAQTTASYLDSIKQLAGKAAVGPFTDKLQFVNALLSQAGNEKATDATTANNLLDKYSNQIVSRLGSGPMGTDAARAILQSAYPNAHMTPEAINEAADNLKGANAMIQARARFLQPHATNRDPASYSQNEVAFDQAADPRIWQLASMDANSASRFLSKLPESVRSDLQRRVQLLRHAGAL